MVSTGFAPEPTWAVLLADGIYVGGFAVVVLLVILFLIFWRRG